MNNKNYNQKIYHFLGYTKNNVESFDGTEFSCLLLRVDLRSLINDA